MKVIDGLRVVVNNSLPRVLRAHNMKILNENAKTTAELVSQAASVVVASYWIQAVRGFDMGLNLAHIGCVLYCVWAASFSFPLFILLGAILCALTICDAYTHGSIVQGAGYYLDAAGTAVATATFLLASQTLTLMLAPSQAVSKDVLFRGAVVCLPLLMGVRLVLRPPPSTPPFQGLKKTGKEIFWLVQRVNVLWILPCIGTILINSQTMPKFMGEHDNLYNALPIGTFVFCALLQQNALIRDDKSQTLVNPERKELLQMKEHLLKGVLPGEENYSRYIAVQVLFFFELAVPSIAGLWPWLTGREASLDVIRLGLNLTTFATLLLTWNYIKNLNRAAADFIQKEIDRLSTPLNSNEMIGTEK